MQSSTTNSIHITWLTVGEFDLEVQEHQSFCSGEILSELITVYDQPTAFAGNTVNSCSGSAVSLTGATAQNFSTLHWTSSGDGTFDDATILKTSYTPGPSDIVAGESVLTLTAEGLGEGATCTPATSTVRINIIKLEAIVSSTNVSCYGAKDGTIEIVNPIGGSGNYQFTINGSVWTNSRIYNNLGPGNYNVQMRDQSLPTCNATLANITITEPDPLAASIRHTDATCLGDDGTITIINPSGGSGSYEYSIGGGWFNGFFAGLFPGTYPVQMRDANVPDCRAVIGSVVISKPAPITAKVTLTHVSCFGGTDGRISITDAVNGSGIYEFCIDGTNWIPENDLSFDNLPAGNYIVRMRDFNAKACAIILSTSTLTQPEQLTAGNTSTNVSCFGGNDGSITVSNPKGGSGKFEFSVDGVNWQTSASFTGLFAGTYILQMRDFNAISCVRMISEVIITEPLKLEAKFNSTDITCYGSNDGTISVTNPKNGYPPFQFTIDGSNWLFSSSFTGLWPKSYPVQMRDSKGCMQDIGTVVIVEPDPLSATVNSTNVTCLGNDGTITITNPESGSGFYEYSIDDTNWTTNGSFTGLTAKTYTVQIRDAKLISCKRIIATIIISEPEPLWAAAIATNVTCFGGNDGFITLSNPEGGSGMYEFSMDGSNWQASEVFSNLAKGSYTVQMRDAMAENCVVTIGTFDVDQPDILTATIVPTDVTCYEGNNGYISFTSQSGGSGNYEYSINGTDWFPTKVENLRVGFYTVQVRDAAAHDCMITLPDVELKQPEQIVAQVDPTNVTCFGGSDGTITISKPLNGAAPYQYSLDGGITWQTDGTFYGLSAKTYDLMVIQDVNSCASKLQTVEITQPEKLEATVTRTNQTNPDAGDGTVTVSGMKGGSGEYQFSIGEDIWQNSPEFTNLAPGNYSVQISDGKAIDCLISISVVILPAGAIQAKYTTTDVSCYHGNDGSITFTETSGATNYEFSITGGSSWLSSPYFSGLSSQNYVLMVRNADIPVNSSELGTVELKQPELLSVLVNAASETFAGAGDARLTITSPKGGSGEYLFSLDETSWGTNTVFTGLSAGTYSVWIQDKNAPDCKVSTQKIIQPAGSLSAEVYSMNVSCNGKSNGNITITDPSGAGSYDFSIDGITWQQNGNFNGLAAKTYRPMLRDRSVPANMASLGEIVITEPKKLEAYFTSNVPLCAGNSGSVIIYARGGSEPFVGTGTYVMAAGERKTFTVTDENGCTDEISYTMPAPSKIIATATVNQPKCSSDNGTVTVRATGGSGIYVGAQTFTVQPGKAYSFIVTDNNGCVSNLISGVMGAAPSKLEATTATTDPLCFGFKGSVTVTAKGGSGNYYYQWDDPATQTTQTATGLAPGIYSVSVTDGNGCDPVSVLALVKEPPAIACSATVTVQPGCFTPEGIVEVTEPLGAEYEYSADGMTYQKSNALTGLAPGDYSVKAREVSTGCESLAIALTVDPVPPVPGAATASVTVNPTCNFPNGTVVVSSPAEGTGYEYNIDGGAYQTSAMFEILKWGDHFVRVRQANSGCESATATLVTVPANAPAPVLAVTAIENATCYGGTGRIRFTVDHATDGIYTLNYDGGEFNNVSFSGGMAQVIALAGNYDNMTIEANGCTSGEKINVTVGQPGQIVINETVTEIDLRTHRKGAIDLSVSGGSGMYSYLWSTGETTQDIQNLNDGSYSVTVTDQNGCTQTKRITIPLPNFPPVAMFDQISVGCYTGTGTLVVNDYDPEGDAFYLDPVPVIEPQHGSLTLNADGSFAYRAELNFTGNDYFRYAIYDANHYLGDTAEVFLVVIADKDCDGIPDDIDPDADGDGIANENEGDYGADTDGDGVPNYLDIDSDNDGIVDHIEAQSTADYIPPLFIGTNGDGLDDAYDSDQKGTAIVPEDTDTDGTPDFMDHDSDSDMVPDYIEGNDQNNDGKADVIVSGKDSDNDGLDDAFDTVSRLTSSGNITGSNAPLQDFDFDGIRDWRDDNDDDDLYLTRFEDLNADGDYSNDDTDHDGHPEYLDYGRDCDLLIPNIFTPNRDNIHDYFVIYCIEHYPNAKIYVFDQNGNKVFEKDHYGNLEFWGTVARAWWNGKNQFAGKIGSVVPVGTYYYVLDLGNGEVRKSYVFVSY
jgi:gliding motility-associated-like protein